MLGCGARERNADGRQAEFQHDRDDVKQGGTKKAADERAQAPDDHHEQDDEALVDVEGIGCFAAAIPENIIVAPATPQ